MVPSKKLIEYFAIGVLLLLSTIIFYFAHKMGDFSYSDAPRHALNGVFILDFFSGFQFQNPMQYAKTYYDQYPAITIGFYPPLVSFIMAAFYAIFGVSHFTAQLCIASFHAGLGVGSYLLARRSLDSLPALAVAVITLTAPVVSMWGSQVMLDVPATCFLIWSVIFLCKWMDESNQRHLVTAVILFIAGLYTKQVIAFLALPVLLTIVCRNQIKLIYNKACISIIPLAGMSYVFGKANMESVAGARQDDLPLASLKAWTYYLGVLPEACGWPVTLFGLAGLIFAIVKWKKIQNDKPDLLMFLFWFIVAYLFYSLIALRMPRNVIQFIFPLSYFSVWLIVQVSNAKRQWISASVTGILAMITVYIGIVLTNVQFVDGYREAALYAQQNIASGKNILFHGNRDGSFIYNVRTFDEKKSLKIIRSDKLFLKLKIERERGVKDLGVSEQDMLKILRDNHIGFIVSQKDFWTDLPSMSRFQNLLINEQIFEKLKTIMIQSNSPTQDKELVIYRFIDADS
jgi:hypothetical protein